MCGRYFINIEVPTINHIIQEIYQSYPENSVKSRSRCLVHLLLLEFFPVCTGLYVRPVYEHNVWVHHAVVQRFIQNIVEYLGGNFGGGESLAERIAYRCKMRGGMGSKKSYPKNHRYAMLTSNSRQIWRRDGKPNRCWITPS